MAKQKIKKKIEQKIKQKIKQKTEFKKFIQDVEAAEQRNIEQTPLLALIVATFLDRLGFVPFINSVVF